MRFPINVTKQSRCPVCKKKGPGTRPLATPRPSTATLSLFVMAHVHGRSYPVFMGSNLYLGWDSGSSKHPRSRTAIGASVLIAKKSGKAREAGAMEVCFCSITCMRKFFNDAIDELDRQVGAAKDEVNDARMKAD